MKNDFKFGVLVGMAIMGIIMIIEILCLPEIRFALGFHDKGCLIWSK